MEKEGRNEKFFAQKQIFFGINPKLRKDKSILDRIKLIGSKQRRL